MAFFSMLVPSTICQVQARPSVDVPAILTAGKYCHRSGHEVIKTVLINASIIEATMCRSQRLKTGRTCPEKVYLLHWKVQILWANAKGLHAGKILSKLRDVQRAAPCSGPS